MSVDFARSNSPAGDGIRGFIKLLETKGELLKVNKTVHSKHEAATVQMKLLKEMNKAVLFTNIDGKGQQMLGNIYISRKMIAFMFNGEPQALIEKVMSFKDAKRLPVKFMEKGPCQEVVHEKFKDIKDIVPIPWNYEKDANFYITAGIVVAKDPETGKINTAICRMMYRGGASLNIFFAPLQHNWMIFNKYKALKKDMPIAVVIGADPFMMFASESGIPYGENEFEYAGAMQGKPVEVVKCKTVDHYIPANAEYILEGVVSWDKTALEGPMGENQRVYGPVSENPIVTITCISHRINPIYQNIIGGTVEEHALLAVSMEARILENLRRVSPRVITLNLLPNFMNCVVMVDDFPPVQRGLGKNIILATLAEPWIKYVVVVNKDVNIDDPNEVNWALSTRADLSKDLLLIEGTLGFVMDPSRKTKHDPVTKIGIDATVDPLEKERFLKSEVVNYDTCNVQNYLEK